jgi:Phage tail protein (Tail_P2_I)
LETSVRVAQSEGWALGLADQAAATHVGRIQLPYLCFCSMFLEGTGRNVTRVLNKNGCFLGSPGNPLFFPTASDAGGLYTRTAVYWDRGISTTLTVRTIVDDLSTYGATTFDMVTLPAVDDKWYLDQPNRWPLPNGHPTSQDVYSIFLGTSNTAAQQILIPRDGSLQLAQAQANYVTISPSMQMINVYPNYVSEVHQYSPYSLFAGAINMSSQYVNKFSGISPTAGSDMLYRQATGLEKAMADVDAYRLTSTYAELVRDQWDPYAISYRNLGYLAWAMGVNLWEDNWSYEFKRWWIVNQWTFKSQRDEINQ